LWFANAGNNSIGRITTKGKVTNYRGTGISSPQGIAAGPDGALWFTNETGNSIGRITTTGTVTNYVGTGSGISQPEGIAAGPDGAMWFANYGDNSIGRITVPRTSPAPGTIFATTFEQCTILRVGYNRFVNGTIVHWRVTTNGVGKVASGQFRAIGGGVLGSKTYHFLNIALGTTLPSDASGIQSHVLFTWGDGGRFYATRDPGC
jgi:streptogramin lyase